MSEGWHATHADPVWSGVPVLRHVGLGTCGSGRELADIVDLEALGGIVTKSVTLEPRVGNAARRVAEFEVGMLNSVGLANPGLQRVRSEELLWIRADLRKSQVFVSLAGHTTEEYRRLVPGLDGDDGFLGFERNLSCPEGAGADGLTLTNTLPGTLLAAQAGSPVLAAGGWTQRARPAARGGEPRLACHPALLHIALVGVGGILIAQHAVQYLEAGACGVRIGAADFADRKCAPRVVAGIEVWGMA